MDKILRKLDMSWEQQIIDSKNAFATSREAGLMQYVRWVLTVMYNLFKSVDDKVDPKAQFFYDKYMNDDTFAKEDLANMDPNQGGFGVHWNEVLTEFETPLFQGTLWVIPVAGVVLASIGLLNYVQSRPRDKYAWGSFLSKMIAGTALIVLAAYSASPSNYATAIPWFMPIIAIVLSSVEMVDMILLHLLLRSARKQTGSLPPMTPSATGYGSEYQPVGTSDAQPLIHGQAPMGRASSLDVSTAGINTYPPTPGHQYSSPPTYGAPSQSLPTISSAIPSQTQRPGHPMGHSSSAPGYYAPSSGAYDPWNAPR
ncbi:hypothetical protein FRC02_008357 [Tulasnella sp. 418]|nr:hypothetical protein FRC02_008357 [Tulasnella sp. 418]